LGDIYSSRHPLADEIRKLAQESEIPVNTEFCIDVILDTLRRTTYTAKARSISLAVGFCTYAARLVESMGAKEYYLQSLPGKGVAIHKMLALAAPALFEDYIKNSLAPSIEKLKDYVEYALEAVELLDRTVKVSDSKREEVLNKAFAMLQNFVQTVKLASLRLGVELDKCKAIPENYFTDFDLHISGTPDLIIECGYGKPRALVIEWKTYGTSPHPWEKVQVYTYALLEAHRLGYGVWRGITVTLRELSELFRAVTDGNPASVAVVPVIIRDSGFYGNHPAFPSERAQVLSPSEVEELLKKIVVAAAHLTMLRSAIPEHFRNEVNEKCRARIKGYEGVLYRWTPRILDKHGNPKSRDSKLCELCKELHPVIYSVCPLFFGEGPTKDVLDKVFWDLRFKIYRIHERALAPLKAMQDIRREDVERAANNGDIIEYNMTEYHKYILKTGDGRGPKLVINYQSTREKVKPLESRFDVFEDVEIFLPNKLSPKHLKPDELYEKYAGEIPYLRFRRKIREYEDKPIVEEGLEDRLIQIRTLRRGKPVLVLFDDGTPQRSSLNFALSLFGRVDRVALDGDIVLVEVTPISNAFRFQFLTVANQIHYHDLRRAIAVEVNVDLTYLELQALLALQKAVKDSLKSQAPEIENQINELKSILNKNRRDLFELIAKVFYIVRRLQ